MKWLLSTLSVWLLFTTAAVAQTTGGTPVRVTNAGGTDVFHDAVLTSSNPNLQGGPLGMCRASTATPSDVSADNDAVMVWCTRKGAIHVNVDNSISAATPSATPCYVVSAASTNSTNCKNTAGTLVGFRFTNSTSTNYYVRFYNSATAPTCSSATNFTESILIPNAAGAGGGIVAFQPGVSYSNGIGYCITAGSASTDNTNAAVGILGAIFYN